MLDDDYGIRDVVGPRMGAVALGLLPEVLARVAAGDPATRSRPRGSPGPATSARLRDR